MSMTDKRKERKKKGAEIAAAGALLRIFLCILLHTLSRILSNTFSYPY
jgi:hypothetical protein